MMPAFWWLAWGLPALLLSAAYSFVTNRYRRGWNAMPDWEPPVGFRPSTFVSVLVPARNEADAILSCLQSLELQSYPPHLYEVIVIDDHSEDETPALVRAFGSDHPRIRLVHLADHMGPGETRAFKKKALSAGIGQARGELIVTTDADCVVQPGWLELLVSLFELQGARFIAAPVNFTRERNLTERFQSLDMMGMMGVTGSGIFLKMNQMCNGANLAYPRATFFEVGGFDQIDHLASGDDMLLMHKVAERWPEGVFFLKNKAATVYTTAKPDWRAFASQRLRWATKSAGYRDWRVTAILAVVFLFCWCLLVGAGLSLACGGAPLFLTIFLLATKFAADYLFLRDMSAYFGRSDLMKSYIPSQFLHIAYIVAIGTAANLVSSYEWKGRRVS
jgi:cellulose synthase/poly-beta-1,6-N-acetylglucosamine synthase-like glycosyltransferase